MYIETPGEAKTTVARIYLLRFLFQVWASQMQARRLVYSSFQAPPLRLSAERKQYLLQQRLLCLTMVRYVAARHRL